MNDYIAYNLHGIKRSPSMKWRLAIGWAIIPCACWIGAALLAKSHSDLAFMLAIGGVMYAFVFPFVQQAWISSSVRGFAQDLGTSGMIGRITLILEDDTFTEQTDTVQSIARWQDMKGVEVVGDCTYIYVTGLLTAIVPRHGFEKAEDYEAVRDFAIAKLGKIT
jgi:YcxB-like protein